MPQANNHWIEVYWPRRPGEPRGKDGFLWLYYHVGKRKMDGKIRKGDRILFYETKRHPDQKWPGGETIFAIGTVMHDAGEPMEPSWSGGKKWVWLRKVRVDRMVPETLGVPMSEVRRVLDWSPRAPIRRGPMRISQKKFDAIAARLNKGRSRVGEQSEASQRPPRQSDPEKRIELERIAVRAATKWYEALGYSVRSVEKDRVGWDLEAECLAHTLLIEVKGLSGHEIAVGLTPNEYAAMCRKTIRPRYRLFVVTAGFKTPKMAEFFYSEKDGCWADANMRRLDLRPIKSAIATANR